MRKIQIVNAPQVAGIKIDEFLKEACYSGERIILKGRSGEYAALVPIEDLEVLESMEVFN